MRDIETYRHSIFPIVAARLERFPNERPTDAANAIAQSTECPILIVAYYMREIKPSVELDRLIGIFEEYYT